MEKVRQNVTLDVDEDLLLAARKVALDQRTSVNQLNQLVREYLAALVEELSRRRLARARLRKAFATGLVEVGDRSGAATISMTAERALIFVDTNVLVYAFDKRRSPKKRLRNG
jgi:putative Ca2+/H+ antiporter (TMEM165/GDT1 family)